ncbi:XVIPCD domain-containing protein [Lysobacter fragariae]
MQANEAVADLDGLVMHHPGANRNSHMQEGRIVGVEDLQPGYRGGDRSYAHIDGEFQEVIDNTTDRYQSLKRDQVLMVKDFILEDPSPAPGASARAVSVPSPTAGYVSLVRDSGGMVEIMDRQGGTVIARVRHLDPISVEVGDTITYGQSLGTQDNKGLPVSAGVHVHIEMDTGHHEQLSNYIDDLASGRLTVQPAFRADSARPAMGDGTFRLGQSDDRIRDLQQVMASEGYRAVSGRPLDQDGVYRPGMQGALLDFQRAHGIPQTGNIDPATQRMAPPPAQRVIDIDDRFVPGRPMYQGPALQPTAPGHPEHPDHRPVPAVAPPAVNQHGRRAATDMQEPASTAWRAMDDHPLLLQSQAAVAHLDRSLGRTPDEASACMSASLACLASENGLTRIDHVVLSRQTDAVRQGENVFVVQGRLEDPAHLVAHMKTNTAMQTPVQESVQRLYQLDRTTAQQTQLAIPEPQNLGESQRRSMTM